jgi:transposase InsO family protein
MAGPASGRRGVRAELPHFPARQGRHLRPAGLLFPLPVPTRRGGCISLVFVELPPARSGHDFLQVHIDLLTGCVWLVPTFKTATSATAARKRRNFVSSVFCDVGLPDVLVSDRDTRFTSAFWTDLHAALGASHVFGSPHHHNTASKVERVNGVFADVLRSFASDRGNDWPELVPLVEFAINDSASTLGSGYTPFYADRSQWAPLENLTARRPSQPSNARPVAPYLDLHSARRSPPAPPPPLPPAGFTPNFTVDAAPPSDIVAALVGRQLLYWWPDDGWQRGNVARLCPRPAFSHVVAFNTRQTSALRGTADSLLDSASYGARGRTGRFDQSSAVGCGIEPVTLLAHFPGL